MAHLVLAEEPRDAPWHIIDVRRKVHVERHGVYARAQICADGLCGEKLMPHRAHLLRLVRTLEHGIDLRGVAKEIGLAHSLLLAVEHLTGGIEHRLALHSLEHAMAGYLADVARHVELVHKRVPEVCGGVYENHRVDVLWMALGENQPLRAAGLASVEICLVGRTAVARPHEFAPAGDGEVQRLLREHLALAGTLHAGLESARRSVAVSRSVHAAVAADHRRAVLSEERCVLWNFSTRAIAPQQQHASVPFLRQHRLAHDSHVVMRCGHAVVHLRTGSHSLEASTQCAVLERAVYHIHHASIAEIGASHPAARADIVGIEV